MNGVLIVLQKFLAKPTMVKLPALERVPNYVTNYSIIITKF